jgi:hypothetical protein
MAGAVDGCRLDLPGEPLTATGSPYPNRSSMPPPGSTLYRGVATRRRQAALGSACARSPGGGFDTGHVGRSWRTSPARSTRLSTQIGSAQQRPRYLRAQAGVRRRRLAPRPAAPGRVEPDRTGLLVATPGSSATWASPMPDPRHLADVQVHRAGRQCAEPVRHWRAPRCSASTASTPPAHFQGWLEARHRRRAERWPGRLDAVRSARCGRVGHVNRIPLGWSRLPASSPRSPRPDRTDSQSLLPVA